MTHSSTPSETPEYPSPAIVDSRRLTGPNLYGTHPGAVMEVKVDSQSADRLIAAWKVELQNLLTALGWTSHHVMGRRERNGATLFFAAPVDVLMTATEVNEQAWAGAEGGAGVGAGRAERLAAMAFTERATRKNLASVYDEAIARGINVTFDDDLVTLGSGKGATSFPAGVVPSSVAWDGIHDVPIALVTGSNGKTTTTRVLAAMWRAAGVVAGWSCSDGVQIDDMQLESGDYAGPGGARVVLRDARVEAAVLETARGGILRRGLAASRADAAIITNISADHFGEYGVETLQDLAEVKAVVAGVLGPSGCLVLNADDAALAGIAAPRCAWFSVAPAHRALDAHVSAGGDAAIVRDNRLMLHLNDVWHDMGDVNAMPITLNGAAPHNVANILGAALLGAVLAIPIDAIRTTLATFGRSPADNPGRLQLHCFGGVTVLVDYAHNPDGLRVLCETAASLPAKRRLLILGQAGNRDDGQIRELVRTALRVTPFDRVIVKETPGLLRGRAAGEISAILVDELARAGVAASRIDQAPSEIESIRKAFEWAREGDVLVCPVHFEKASVGTLLQHMIVAEWKAGDALPRL